MGRVLRPFAVLRLEGSGREFTACRRCEGCVRQGLVESGLKSLERKARNWKVASSIHVVITHL